MLVRAVPSTLGPPGAKRGPGGPKVPCLSGAPGALNPEAHLHVTLNLLLACLPKRLLAQSSKRQQSAFPPIMEPREPKGAPGAPRCLASLGPQGP